MTNKKKIISIITPTFNEGERVIKCCGVIKNIFETHLKNYDLEHIVCDNGSSIESVNIVKELPNAFPSVKVILNRRNFGVLNNAYNGAMASNGDATLLLLPVDLQDPPELIPKMVSLWEEGNEIVYGIRKRREENYIFKFLRNFFYFLLSKTSYIPYKSGIGDFQLIDKRILNEIKLINDKRPFLRMMTFKIGGKSTSVEYTWKNAGRPPKNTIFNMFDQSFIGLISFSTFPLRLITILGILFASLSFTYVVYSIIHSLIFSDGILRGIKSILVGVYFIGGLILFAIGIVGEYIVNINENVRNHKVVYEQERIGFKKKNEM